MTGDIRIPLGAIPAPKLSAKKIMGRRRSSRQTRSQLYRSEFVSAVANEEGIGDYGSDR